MVELCVFLLLRYGVMIAGHLGLLPAWLEFLPMVELSWAYFLLVVALLVWRLRKRDSKADFGLGTPIQFRSIIGPALGGIVIVFVLDGISAPLLESVFGSSQDLSRFRWLVGNVGSMFMMLVLAWVFAAFGEEVFFRGWLMPRLSELLGGNRLSEYAAWILQAVLFGLIHLYQGPGGMIGTGIYGLMYGALVMKAGGRLWAAILAHGLIDSFGVLAIYAGALPV